VETWPSSGFEYGDDEEEAANGAGLFINYFVPFLRQLAGEQFLTFLAFDPPFIGRSL
jgi:hypothetical protein